MDNYKYQKVDAFTSDSSTGNPAACIYLDKTQSLSETAMLEIAKQHKGFVSEVIYCRSHDGIFLTYYSSECEVSFCGHGTIACMYNLIKQTPHLYSCREIPIQTNKKGGLTVYNRIAEQDAVFISAPKAQYIEANLEPKQVMEQLSLDAEDGNNLLPLAVIDAGLRTLIVPLHAMQRLIAIFPQESQLKNFCLQNDLDIILVFVMEAVNKTCIAHTRVFAPKFGYLEDPATGSGNSAFGYYLLKNDLWDGTLCAIEQGGKDRIFNTVKLHYQDDTMLFGGKATMRIEGTYFY